MTVRGRIAIGECEVLGEKLDIQVSSRDGTFYLVQGDGRAIGSGDSLAKAKVKAREHLNKYRVEVAVPFLSPNGSRGTAVRRHPKTRDIHIVWDETGGEDAYAFSTARSMFAADTPVEKITRFNELREIIRSAEQERRQIEADHGFDIGAAVDRAVEEKVEEVISTEGIEGVS